MREPIEVLALRSCNADGTSYRGFQWPLEVGATVEAPDWSPAAYCGNGLHGLLWGEGDAEMVEERGERVWMVVAIPADVPIVELGGKIKFPRCVIRHIGDRTSATAFMLAARPGSRVAHSAIIADENNGPAAQVGGRGVAVARGDEQHATSGDCGVSLALGYRADAVCGRDGVAIANDGSAEAGSCGVAVAAGEIGGAKVDGVGGIAISKVNGAAETGVSGLSFVKHGKATTGGRGVAVCTGEGSAQAGDAGLALAVNRWNGVATVGDFGMAVAGGYCKATAGNSSRAFGGETSSVTVGDQSIAFAGVNGHARAGRRSVIAIEYRDVNGQLGVAVGQTAGVDGSQPADSAFLEPGRWYGTDWQGKLVPVSPSPVRD